MESNPVGPFRKRDIYMRMRNNPQGLFRRPGHGFKEIRGRVPIMGANGAGRPPKRFLPPPPVNRLISSGGSLEPPRTNV